MKKNYNREAEKYGNHFDKIFYETNILFNKLPYINTCIEIGSDYIKFIFEFENDKFLFLTYNDIWIYSFFINKNLISSDIVVINEFIIDFIKYLENI